MNDDCHQHGAELFLRCRWFFGGMDRFAFTHDEHALARSFIDEHFMGFAEIVSVGTVKMSSLGVRILALALQVFVTRGAEFARG